MDESDDVINSLKILREVLVHNSKLNAQQKKPINDTPTPPVEINDVIPKQKKVKTKKTPKKQVNHTSRLHSYEPPKSPKQSVDKSPQQEKYSTKPRQRSPSPAKYTSSPLKRIKSKKAAPSFYRDSSTQTSEFFLLDDEELAQRFLSLYGDRVEVITPAQQIAIQRTYFYKWVSSFSRKLLTQFKAQKSQTQKPKRAHEVNFVFDDPKGDSSDDIEEVYPSYDDPKDAENAKVSFPESRPESATIVELGDSGQFIDSIGSALQESPIPSNIGDDSIDDTIDISTSL